MYAAFLCVCVCCGVGHDPEAPRVLPPLQRTVRFSESQNRCTQRGGGWGLGRWRNTHARTHSLMRTHIHAHTHAPTHILTHTHTHSVEQVAGDMVKDDLTRQSVSVPPVDNMQVPKGCTDEEMDQLRRKYGKCVCGDV